MGIEGTCISERWVIEVGDEDSEPVGTPEEIEGLRDAIALVFALRAGNRAAARQILSLRGGTDLPLVEALVGVIETFGIDAAARLDMSVDELLRQVSVRLAAQPGPSEGTRAEPS